jgi:DNA (cytosine-5)-methyltransferase 1
MRNEMRTCHLFAGIGGGLLADLILGHEPIVAVEWEPYACKVLRERAAEGWFPGLHVWEGDVRLFDPSEYAGIVDCIHAGFPCQDISVAGKRAGVSEGTRSGLYREVLRIADIVRPRYLFLENVAAILYNGLGTVLADLAAMGYDSRWLCIRASDVAAPHRRDRWFALADSGGGRFSEQDERKIQLNGGTETISTGKNVADANSVNAQGKQPRIVDAEEREGQDKRPSGPFGDGIGWWTTEPALGRVAHGVPNRVGQLKGYGNAQVPLQAATAWRLLGGK